VVIFHSLLCSCVDSFRSRTVRRFLALALAAACVFLAAAVHAQDKATPSGRYYEVHGSRLYVQSLGTGAPIVFLHGGLRFFDSSFPKQRDYFASFRRVIGIDQRGHGHSPDNSKPLSYARMAEDTAAVIERLGLGAVDVVGHSDGGNVGLILARDHPRLVRRLVISGANLGSGISPEELKRRSEWSPQQIAEKVRAMAAKIPPAFRTEYAKVAPDGPVHWDTLLAKSYQLWSTPVVIPAADLKAIKIPVLVMAGDHDFTSIEETLEIYRNLTRGQLFILPDTGHGTMSQRAELVNLAMRQFFEAEVAKP
jgi:pimeloyl-ACP methyl ester carboxylesterase